MKLRNISRNNRSLPEKKAISRPVLRGVVVTVILFSLSAGLVLSMEHISSPADRSLRQNKPIHFMLPSVTDGAPVDSRDYRGTVLLVTFFATWCPPCLQEIPSLIALHEQYRAKGFSVIGLALDQDDPQAVTRLIQREKINYPVLRADNSVAREFGGIIGVPTTFLLDREGKIRNRYIGYASHDILEEDIRKALQ